MTDHRHVVRITRRSGADVALIAADELAGLIETAHLLRSPKNAARLLAAIEQARAALGQPQSTAELRREVGFDKDKLGE